MTPPSEPVVPVAPVAPAAPARKSFAERIAMRPDPLTSVALTLPVFLVYHLGILLVTTRIPADLVSSLTFALLDASVSGYVITTCAFALALALAVWVQQKRGATPVWNIGRVLIESAAYSVLLLATVGWAAYRLAHTVALASARDLGPIDKLVLAAGSGFHEELVFRVVLVSGLAALLARATKWPRSAALTTAALLSSLAFAFTRFLGPLGDPFAPDIFLYHALAGLAFAGIYLMRGFAVAVYSHAFYTALVFFIYA